MNGDWLRTLIAVVDEGSFEAAADELHVSASAVSQRIKALEQHLGRVLVRRTIPCVATPAGEGVLRLARQSVLLEDETLAELGRTSAGGDLPVVVNADSLATWFRPVLGVAAGWPEVVLRLAVEDQDHSADMLRRGDVVAAVTSSPAPVTGCRTEPLGVMRYLPVAAPALLERAGCASGDVDWERLPAMRYNAKDDLQLAFLRERGATSLPPQPQVPGSEAFLAAVRAGLGWGLIPEAQLGDDLDRGVLVRLGGKVTRTVGSPGVGEAPEPGKCRQASGEPGPVVDVALHWQVWRVDSERIRRLTDAVHDAARTLRHPGNPTQR